MLGIFLDTETNGLDPRKHTVLEIAFQILDVQTGQILDSYASVIKPDKNAWDASDPQSLQVNGLRWEDVSKGTSIEQVSLEIQQRFERVGVHRKNAVFICQNPSFDRPFFSQIVSVELQERKVWPYHWLDLASMYWAMNIRRSPWEKGLSKDKIAQYYHLAPEATPHRAMNGVQHLVLCYKAVVGFGQ